MTTGKSSFRIVVGENPQSTQIELNGKPLHGVRRVSFDLNAGQRDLSFIKLEIMGEALVEGEFVEQPIALSAGVPQEKEQE